MPGKRQPNGRPKIFFDKHDQRYHMWVTVGRRPNGALDRKNLAGRTMTEVADQYDDLMDRLKRGAPTVDKIETVEQWLVYWLEVITKERREYKTYAAYHPIIYKHVIPEIGRWRLDGRRNVLSTEHVEAMLAALRRKPGQKPGTTMAGSYVRQCWAVLRKALKDAMRRGRASRNVCDMMDPPTFRRRRVPAHSADVAAAILRTAVEDELAERWLIGMLLGPRQGEALGLRWHRVHLDTDVPHVELVKQVQRQSYEHGCKDPAECARPHCRTETCPPRWQHGCGLDPADCTKHRTDRCPQRRPLAGCARHERECPKPCPAGCTDHARWCEHRRGGLVEKDLKTEKGERKLPLFPMLTELLRVRRESQQRAGTWTPEGLVFPAPPDTREGRKGRRTGEFPIDPRRDHEAWEALLAQAGVPDSPLHAARHTSGTFLVATGTDITVVREILGHTDIRVTQLYVDVAEELKKEAVKRIAAALMDGQLASLLLTTGAHAKVN